MKIRILDADPIKAARSLVYSHIRNTIKVLRFTFTACHNQMMFFKYKRGYASIVKYSVENYVWFSEFYEELMKLCKSDIKGIKEFNESYLYDCSDIKFKHTGLNLFPDEKGSFTDLLAASRLAYIEKGYNIKQFPVGVPEWYIDTNEIVYEKYDAKTDKSFRVVKTPTHFRYFIAEYFNQWVEIVGISQEIEELIKHLIYRK